MDVKRYTKGTKLSLRIIGLFMVITLLSGTLLPVGVMATTGEEIGIPEEVLPPEEPTDSEEEMPEDVDEADAVSEQETADDTITEETPDSEEDQTAEEPTPDSEPETEEETAAETPTDDVPDSEEEPVKTEDDTAPETAPDEGPAEEQTQPEENADEPVSDEETADDVPVVDDAADAVLGDIAGDEPETEDDAADELVWDDPEDLNSLAESFFEALSDKAFATAEILEFAEGAVEALTGAVLKITELAVDDLGGLFVNYVGEEIQNYAVFDLGFYLDDESEVEPGTEVAVTVDLTEYLADQAYDPASLVLYHHEEDEWGEVVNTAAVASYEDGGITVDEETGAVTAMFTVNSFSAFTLRWSNTEEIVEEDSVDVLFNELMACETYEELDARMEDMTEEEYELMAQFTDEQNAALMERIDELSEYDAVNLAETRSIEYYRGDVDVYWDETDGTTTRTGSEDNNIESVTLKGLDVTWGNSSLGSGWSDVSKQVKDYYPDASVTNAQTVELSITPAEGYYVTRVVVACCPATVSPYKCSTWSSGLAYDQNMSVNVSGTLTIDLSVVAFCHDNNNKENDHQYFILIQTAPLPSPLYVEYDYGEIGTILTEAGYNLSETVFDNPDEWTDDNDDNYYGSYYTNNDGSGVQTEDTQMKYMYISEDEVDAANWTHTTNTITINAHKDAAMVGYYFAGWKAQYYETCTEEETSSSGYNKYDYTFTKEYGQPFMCEENVAVQLATNLRLVAQWEPIELTVTKKVAGLTGSYTNDSHFYVLQLQKWDAEYEKWSNVDNPFTLPVVGNNTSSEYTVSPVTPGKYRVVEDESSKGDFSGNDNTIMYFVSVDEGGTVEYTIDDIVDGTTRKHTLEVINTYDDEPANQNLTVIKTVSGNMGDRSKEFNFTVTYGDTTESFLLSHNDDKKFAEVPVGVIVTILEILDGYTYSLVSIVDAAGDTVKCTALENGNGITFTMPASDVTVTFNNEKEAIIDTGILLDSFPYIILFAVVGTGVILTASEKRRTFDD